MLRHTAGVTPFQAAKANRCGQPTAGYLGDCVHFQAVLAAAIAALKSVETCRGR